MLKVALTKVHEITLKQNEVTLFQIIMRTHQPIKKYLFLNTRPAILAFGHKLYIIQHLSTK